MIFFLCFLSKYSFFYIEYSCIYTVYFFSGHLHSGNVLVCDIENIKLTGIENSTLGLPPYYRSFLVQLGKRHVQSLNDADIYGFGHILYELTENEPLTRPFCEHFSQKTSLNLSKIILV